MLPGGVLAVCTIWDRFPGLGLYGTNIAQDLRTAGCRGDTYVGGLRQVGFLADA